MSAAWNSPERDITPEPAVWDRRRWLKAAGWGTAALAVGGSAWWATRRASDHDVLTAGQYADMPGADLYPAATNPAFGSADRPLTAEAEAARYCNFFEFSVLKGVWAYVGAFQPVPWSVEVTGLVAEPRTFDIEELVRTFSLEERVYRHRCVEAWAMVVPWVGFPFAELARRVAPLPSARYVRFVSFERPEEASRQANSTYPWPYTEGLTLAEATNDLTFLATGMYGHPLLKQHGAPLRLVVPWKYGFKSAKSIVRIEFTEEPPVTFWNALQPDEYGFEANVNPDVAHPRWSQGHERLLGTGEQRPTLFYNGYGEWVAHLYGNSR